MTTRERFEKKYKKDPYSNCWIWTATTYGRNYGGFKLNGKPKYAHRVSWELYEGPIPKGMFVLHHCDEPLCVNPWHLFLGTQADNLKDMDKKGRRREYSNSNK